MTNWMKGYRTYAAIVATALVVGLHQIGILNDGLFELLVSVLTVAGLYFRSKA